MTNKYMSVNVIELSKNNYLKYFHSIILAWNSVVDSESGSQITKFDVPGLEGLGEQINDKFKILNGKLDANNINHDDFFETIFSYLQYHCKSLYLILLNEENDKICGFITINNFPYNYANMLWGNIDYVVLYQYREKKILKNSIKELMKFYTKPLWIAIATKYKNPQNFAVALSLCKEFGGKFLGRYDSFRNSYAKSCLFLIPNQWCWNLENDYWVDFLLNHSKNANQKKKISNMFLGTNYAYDLSDKTFFISEIDKYLLGDENSLKKQQLIEIYQNYINYELLSTKIDFVNNIVEKNPPSNEEISEWKHSYLIYDF